jgi:ectoine hydroxylase-related dioxygenase (phytanoyl-CoA dioxygenase family)
MPGKSTLTPEELAEFERRGMVRLAGFLSPDRVRHAREYVQLRLASVGLWKDGSWNLNDMPRPQWPHTGLKPSKVIGNKHPDVEALLKEPALIAAVDVLLDGAEIERTLARRPQVLFTVPNSDTWTVPHGWHVDLPRLASGRMPGVQLFAFLDTVEPRGGGTLVIAGSHRLLNDGRALRVKEITRLLCREGFLRELYTEAPAGSYDRASLLGQTGTVGDVEIQVVELTGSPGDAYLMDLRVLHTAAPNASVHPRIMVTHRFIKADVMQELTETFGWE